MTLTEVNSTLKREAPSTGDYVKGYQDADGSYIQPIVLVDENGDLIVTAGTVPVSGTITVTGSIAAATIQAILDEMSPTPAVEGEAASLRISLNRNLYTTIRDAEGNERGLNIDPSGRVTVNLAPNTLVKLLEGNNLIGRVKIDSIGENMYVPNRFGTPGMLSIDDKNRLEIISKAEFAELVNVSITNVTTTPGANLVLANNTERAGVIIYNDHDTTIAYIKFGNNPATSSFSWRLEPRDTWTMTDPIYMGVITHIGSAAAGTLRVTELY